MNGRGPGGPRPGGNHTAPKPAATPKPTPKPAAPKPAPRPISPRQTRPVQPPRINPWKDPTPRPRPVPRRRPRVIVPTITHKRSTIKLSVGESCYYEGRVTVDTNLLFDTCDGYFYITSERLIMDSPRNSFNVYISDVSKCRKIVGGVELTIISRAYRIITQDASVIKKLIDELMYQYNEVYDTTYDVDYASHNSYVAPTTVTTAKQTVVTPVIETSDVDPYEEIKKLKELMDMGIISRAEFEMKKKQLLGI